MPRLIETVDLYLHSETSSSTHPEVQKPGLRDGLLRHSWVVEDGVKDSSGPLNQSCDTFATQTGRSRGSAAKVALARRFACKCVRGSASTDGPIWINWLAVCVARRTCGVARLRGNPSTLGSWIEDLIRDTWPGTIVPRDLAVALVGVLVQHRLEVVPGVGIGVADCASHPPAAPACLSRQPVRGPGLGLQA